MTNHEHDRDLIMALAEGSLEPARRSRRMQAIAACDDCAVEFELAARRRSAFTAAAPPWR